MPTRVIPLVLPALVMAAAGCNDTALVLRIASNRPPRGLDAMCLELDAGGAQRFGRRYNLSSLPLPQTLTVLPGGRDATQAVVYGAARGVEVARARRQLSFTSGKVLHVDLPLDACERRPAPLSLHAAAPPTGDPVDAAALVPGAGDGGDLGLTLAAGQSMRWSASGSGLGALAGGAPEAPAAAVRAVVAADLDGDCRLDALVLADGAAPTAWHDGADGTFTPLGALGAAPAVAAAVGDVDGDGAADVVAAGGAEAHVYLGDGAGQFHELADPLDAAPGDATAVALADLDGDGHLDLVVGQGSATAGVSRVYLNDKSGSGHFTYTPAALPPQPGRVSAVAAGDVDGDGDTDVVMAQRGGPLRLYVNRGDAYLDDRSFTLLPDQTSADVPSLLLADLDGDCLPDLVVPRAGAAPLVWTSAGGGRFVAAPALDQAVEAAGALADDVDGDGRPDLLLYGAQTGVQLELSK